MNSKKGGDIMDKEKVKAREFSKAVEIVKNKGINVDMEYLINFHNESKDLDYLVVKGMEVYEDIEDNIQETRYLTRLINILYIQSAILIKDLKDEIVSLDDGTEDEFIVYMKETSCVDLWNRIHIDDRTNLILQGVAFPDNDKLLELGLLLLLPQQSRGDYNGDGER